MIYQEFGQSQLFLMGNLFFELIEKTTAAYFP